MMAQRRQRRLVKLIRRLYRQYILGLMVLLFCLSFAISPIVAQVSEPTAVQNQINPTRLVNQSHQLYQDGDFGAAQQLLDQAIAEFERRNDIRNQGIALSNLSLVNQKRGHWGAAQTTIAKSLELLQAYPDSLALAQSFDIKGQLEFATGQSENALSSWEKASNLYVKLEKPNRALQSQINQVQAMQKLGLYPQACQTLLVALKVRVSKSESSTIIFSNQKNKCALLPGELEIIQSQLQEKFLPKNLAIRLRGLRSLADIMRAVGTLKKDEKSEVKINGSKELLELLLSRITSIDFLPREKSAIALSFAETELALARRLKVWQASQHQIDNSIESVQQYCQEAMKSPDLMTQVYARLNYITVLAEFVSNERERLVKAWNKLQSEFARLPPSQDAVYAQLYPIHQYFRSLQQGDDLEIENPYTFLSISEVKNILNRAEHQAIAMGSDRVKAYVLGYQGQLQEIRKQWEEAERITNLAISLATRNQFNDPSAEITYKLFWQLGRIYKAQYQEQKAIDSYSQAFDLLRSIRRDLISSSPESQFDFRDSVAPLYRQFVDLLLAPQKQPTAKSLKKAREVIEALQLAELDDYFQDACSDVQATNLDRIVDRSRQDTAILYPILLDNRIEVILKLPNRPLHHYRTRLDDLNLAVSKIKKLRKLLSDIGSPKVKIKTLSQDIHRWLIAPIENRLEENKIKTLVFVLDSDLRNIPMSVLYDGQQYLIEKYAIALTPGLQLLPTKPLSDRELIAITGGISESQQVEGQPQPFQAVPDVKRQLSAIRSEISVVEELINNRLTRSNLSVELKKSDFSILHLATHGQFSSNPNKTFILLKDGLLYPNELSVLLSATERQEDRTIELLVLSVCHTATGDDRAVLGLAGVAVRSGARSTLATLWKADEKATTDLVIEFYKQLNKGMTKAQALQEAQRVLIEGDADPFLWAPFILVGSWF